MEMNWVKVADLEKHVGNERRGGKKNTTLDLAEKIGTMWLGNKDEKMQQ